MTKDRDFKKYVRARSAKTGESYQAARRQLDRRGERCSARVDMVARTPHGILLGCTLEAGAVTVGMPITIVGDGALHHAVVRALRVFRSDLDVVTEGQFGLTVEPPYDGPNPQRVEG